MWPGPHPGSPFSDLGASTWEWSESGQTRQPATRRQRGNRDAVSEDAELNSGLAAGVCRAGEPVLLIVEDEILVRTVAVEMAKGAGFAVLEAVDAEEPFGSFS